MPVFDAMLRRAYLAIAMLSWSALLGAAAIHGVLSFLLLKLAGETQLTANLIDFAYFYVTTATTVGYGDLSPSNASGRIVGLCFVLPGSISLFTAYLGKAVTDLSTMWGRRMNGLGDYAERIDHTVVLGWQGIRTRRLIDLLLADNRGGERIVLVAKTLEQNPLPKDMDYIRSDGLSTPSGLQRAGASGAQTIVVRGADDDETLAATLAANSIAPQAHIVAYFEDERSAELIERQCPRVEAIGSLSAELLVRASRDPGASRMADRLFSSKSGDTAFSLKVPDGTKPMSYMKAFVNLKRSFGLTLVGRSDSSGRHVNLNCDPDSVIKCGDSLFYIADARINSDDIDWSVLVKDLPS